MLPRAASPSACDTMQMRYNLISGSEREEPTCKYLSMSTQIILFRCLLIPIHTIAVCNTVADAPRGTFRLGGLNHHLIPRPTELRRLRPLPGGRPRHNLISYARRRYLSFSVGLTPSGGPSSNSAALLSRSVELSVELREEREQHCVHMDAVATHTITFGSFADRTCGDADGCVPGLDTETEPEPEPEPELDLRKSDAAEQSACSRASAAERLQRSTCREDDDGDMGGYAADVSAAGNCELGDFSSPPRRERRSADQHLSPATLAEGSGDSDDDDDNPHKLLTSGLSSVGFKRSEQQHRLQARLWSYLMENLHRAVDEIYYMCEHESMASGCTQAVSALTERISDFEQLKERIRMQERFGEGELRSSITWEVQTSPLHAPSLSNAADRHYPTAQARPKRRSLTENSSERVATDESHGDIEESSDSDHGTSPGVERHLTIDVPSDEESFDAGLNSSGSTSTTAAAPISSASSRSSKRSPSKRFEAFEKRLLTPERRKKTAEETLREQIEKQERAEKLRSMILSERQGKLREAASRAARVSAAQEEQRLKRRLFMDERHEKAEQLHEAHVQAILTKAGKETQKVKEVRFINQMMESNRHLDLKEKLEDRELRRESQLSQNAAKRALEERQAAAQEKRRVMEAERKHKLQEKAERRLQTQQRRAKEKEKARERRDAKAEEAVRKVEHDQTHEQEEFERLEHELVTRLNEVSRRKKEYMESIKGRSVEERVVKRESKVQSHGKPAAGEGQHSTRDDALLRMPLAKRRTGSKRRHRREGGRNGRTKGPYTDDDQAHSASPLTPAHGPSSVGCNGELNSGKAGSQSISLQNGTGGTGAGYVHITTGERTTASSTADVAQANSEQHHVSPHVDLHPRSSSVEIPSDSSGSVQKVIPVMQRTRANKRKLRKLRQILSSMKEEISSQYCPQQEKWLQMRDRSRTSQRLMQIISQANAALKQHDERSIEHALQDLSRWIGAQGQCVQEPIDFCRAGAIDLLVRLATKAGVRQSKLSAVETLYALAKSNDKLWVGMLLMNQITPFVDVVTSVLHCTSTVEEVAEEPTHVTSYKSACMNLISLFLRSAADVEQESCACLCAALGEYVVHSRVVPLVVNSLFLVQSATGGTPNTKSGMQPRHVDYFSACLQLLEALSGFRCRLSTRPVFEPPAPSTDVTSAFTSTEIAGQCNFQVAQIVSKTNY